MCMNSRESPQQLKGLVAGNEAILQVKKTWISVTGSGFQRKHCKSLEFYWPLGLFPHNVHFPVLNLPSFSFIRHRPSYISREGKGECPTYLFYAFKYHRPSLMSSPIFSSLNPVFWISLPVEAFPCFQKPWSVGILPLIGLGFSLIEF